MPTVRRGVVDYQTCNHSTIFEQRDQRHQRRHSNRSSLPTREEVDCSVLCVLCVFIFLAQFNSPCSHTHSVLCAYTRQDRKATGYIHKHSSRHSIHYCYCLHFDYYLMCISHIHNTHIRSRAYSIRMGSALALA